jgi:hypothetical protein
MALSMIKQYSSLSRFSGVDVISGDPLPEQVWSDKAWATEFADGLKLDGLTLSWAACAVYLRNQNYAIPAGSYTFTPNPAYSTSVVVWLDPTSGDNLAVDETLLDGLHDAPAAPVVEGDFLRLAWGTMGAGASEMALHVLRHVEV